MSCGKAVKLFENIPKIRRMLQTLCDVGLDYLTLGQAAPTLSGGEAQRVKLAAELSRPDTGRTLYLLDEPTTGLHFDDIAKLLDVLNRLVDLGNTVVVIEHNLDVIKTADWVIDMGPEAGDGGGYLVASGTPDDIAAYAEQAAQPAAGAAKTTSRARKQPAAKAAVPLDPAPASLAHGRGPDRSAGQQPASEARCSRFRGRGIGEAGRPGHHRSGQRRPHALGSRRPALAHAPTASAARGSPAAGTDASWRRSSTGLPSSGHFGEPNWNARTWSRSPRPTKTDGWFFHAHHRRGMAAEAEVPRRQEHVQARRAGRAVEAQAAQRHARSAGLRPRAAREVQEPPRAVPGSAAAGARAATRSTRPAFWKFFDAAIAGFNKFANRVRQNPEDVMPWKVLGQKWHFARKGFPPGKPPQWDIDVLEELCELLHRSRRRRDSSCGTTSKWCTSSCRSSTSPGPRSTPSARRRIDLTLTGPKGHFALGRIDRAGRRARISDRTAARHVAIAIRLHRGFGQGRSA